MKTNLAALGLTTLLSLTACGDTTTERVATGGVAGAIVGGPVGAVVERAKSVLQALEQGDRKGGARPAALIDDLPLFRAAPPAPVAAPAMPSAIEARLRAVLPDELTPMEALRLVYDLRGMLGDTSG